MRENMKLFIQECNKKIKKEHTKINIWKKRISECESIIGIVSQTDNSSAVQMYRNKIDEYLIKIDNAMEEIRHNESIKLTLRDVDKIIKRGVKKCA
ncbi:MAG: hypothetical protein IJN50_00860 [Clostridia bacterium]|nr:hypothetical protein [Clostridia bacterium]